MVEAVRRAAWSCTIQPVTANSAVTAKDVESRTFQSSEMRLSLASIPHCLPVGYVEPSPGSGG